jgi:hypothetical protein
VLHLFPHWNWSTPGQPINIWAFGNCQAVELFTTASAWDDRRSMFKATSNGTAWPYAAGTLQAIGYNNGTAVMTNTMVTTTGPAAHRAVADRSTILADGRDVSVVTVEVLDAQGNVVPTATNNISFSISGGAIIGVGNGNPSSHEADQASQRMVFNGLAEIIVQSTNQPGSITLTATSTGLTSTNVTITAASSLPAPAAPTGMAAVGGNALVTVTWDIIPGATTYNLWRATTQRRSLHAHRREHRGSESGLYRQQRHQPDHVLLCGHRQWKRHERQFGGSQRHSGSHCHRPDGDRRERPDSIELERLTRRQLQCEAFHVTGGPYSIIASANRHHQLHRFQRGRLPAIFLCGHHHQCRQ